MKKWALIHLGSDLTYGMTFFAGELLKSNQSIHWFDGDDQNVIPYIKSFDPDYVCFGPLSSEFKQSIDLTNKIKKEIPNALFVFGGHHVKAMPEELENNKYIDYLIWGPCYNVIDKILSNKPKLLIKGSPINPQLMTPAISEYFEQIPRIGKRPRTYILSHFGCVYNCSYCCTDIFRKAFGIKDYKKYWLTRRPVKNLIEEAKISKNFGTQEIGINDDDFLYDTHSNGQGTEWIKNFTSEWKKHINLPTHLNVSPMTVLKASPETMQILASFVQSVQMGLQTVGEGSKKIFNRSYQTEEIINKACEKLVSYNLKIKMDIIIGLPNIDGLVPDPIEDAINTIKACQKLDKKFPGMIRVQCFNLILFPGTKLWDTCTIKNIPRRDAWNNYLYQGKGSIVFDEETERKLHNITKMATMFIKFGITEEWIRTLIDVKLTDNANRKFSECNYLDSIKFRLNNMTDNDCKNIIKEMAFKY